MCCSTLKYVCCYGDGDHRTLHVLTHSFPTRRSSDLTKKPSMYKVLMLNDDYTPMEFVVHVLEKFFGKNREEATRIMLHEIGSAHVCTPVTNAHLVCSLLHDKKQEHDHIYSKLNCIHYMFYFRLVHSQLFILHT